MKLSTYQQLISLNHNFYNQAAESFNSTRQQPWPGWYELLSILTPFEPLSVADLGCGNGRFFKFLIEHQLQLQSGVGYDNSRPLLDLAYQNSAIRYQTHDIFSSLPALQANVITSFGVWHHLPGRHNRKNMLLSLINQVQRPGIVILSLWHVTGKKTLPPPIVESESGDLFIGWQNQPDLVRYCHQFDETEINDLMTLPSSTVGRFESDGKDGHSNTYLYYIIR